jgi:putative intracellular protease/amidase
MIRDDVSYRGARVGRIIGLEKGTDTAMNKNNRVLFVLTSHSQLGTSGVLPPTGAYLPEIAHPYEVLTKAGFEVDFVSVKGGVVPLYGTDSKDPVVAAFLEDAATMDRLHASLEPSKVDPSKYAAIFYAGGHGTMWDFPDEPTLARIAGAIYDAGGVVGAVCHGPAGLLNVRLSNGELLVRGREVAGFTNDEERAAKLAEIVPFFLADKLTSAGAVHRAAPNWQEQVIVSGRLVTGQNPQSATGVGKAMLELLRA